MIPKNMNLKSYFDTNAVVKNPELLESLSQCYKDIFNGPPWNENWTLQAATEKITSTLTPQEGRTPLLTLLFYKEKVIGFLWIILTDCDKITLEDMPYDVPEKDKTNGLKVVRYWLEKNQHKKIVIFREVGILEEHRRVNEFRVGTLMIPPIIKEAFARDFTLLFYWTKIDNPVYELGLGFGWHPIHFYPDHDLVILKGGISNFLHCLEKIFVNDQDIFVTMTKTKSLYTCK